jgi:hypothetical protein
MDMVMDMSMSTDIGLLLCQTKRPLVWQNFLRIGFKCPMSDVRYRWHNLQCPCPTMLVCLTVSRRLHNPYGEIGSGYPSMSMIVIGLSLPILRQRWSWLVYDVYWLLNGCCNVGSKYLEYNSSIRTENTPHNRTLNNGTKALNWTKENRQTKVKQ